MSLKIVGLSRHVVTKLALKLSVSVHLVPVFAKRALILEFFTAFLTLNPYAQMFDPNMFIQSPCTDRHKVALVARSAVLRESMHALAMPRNICSVQ